MCSLFVFDESYLRLVLRSKGGVARLWSAVEVAVAPLVIVALQVASQGFLRHSAQKTQSRVGA